MKIKICGITNLKDAEYASSLGADFLGFIFYPASKRNIAIESAKSIIEKLNSNTVPVAVFVNEDIFNIIRVIKSTSIKTVQLHGDEDDNFVRVLKNEGLYVIKTICIKDSYSFNNLFKYSAPDMFLLDTWQPQVIGGSGVTFDWGLLKNKDSLVNNSIIAGGINASNVKKLISLYAPYCIDVSSSLEKSPGIKDHKKMRIFFEIIKK